MKILYFIGNGFDINLGMNTRYSDFYNYYKLQEPRSEIITKLKDEISNGIDNWSDLELALGKYTSKLKDINEFDEVFEDIVDNLADYLTKLEESYDFEKINKNKFFENLCRPENYLTNEDIEEFKIYKQNWHNAEWNVKIVTFNYTTAIEKIISNSTFPIPIGTNNGYNIFLKDIQHIHGFTDRLTVLGVNDVSQIDNVDFHTNQEVLEALIKTKCNKVQRHNVDKVCENQVNEANLICIFGSSLGETDNYWWQLISEQLRRQIRLIIFSRGDVIKDRFSHKVVRDKRNIKKVFLDKTNLTVEEKELYGENIYIGFNTNMFDINIK